MFKDLNEALVKVLKIDPNSKKARQYSGFSVNGDEITFSVNNLDADGFVNDESFDVLSGTKKRAPKLFVKLNLELLNLPNLTPFLKSFIQVYAIPKL